MSPPLVSVVTPVRNGAPLLAECIRSVLGQTLTDFEYLIVDNASTDGSATIARELARGDPRVRVIAAADVMDQVPNFNRALRAIAPGTRYCKVVQADDWLYPECLAEMVRVAEADPEIAIVGALRLAGDTVKCQGFGRPTDEVQYTITDGREPCRAFLLGGIDVFGSPTSILYRASLVRERPEFYPVSGLHEDTEVCFDLLDGRRFGFVHRILTFSRVDNVSASSPLRRFDPGYRGSRLTMLTRFGRRYLDRTEFAREWPRVEADLYRFIADGSRRPDREEFLAYYETLLEGLGSRLDRGRLARTRLARMFWAAVNPVATVRALLRER